MLYPLSDTSIPLTVKRRIEYEDGEVDDRSYDVDLTNQTVVFKPDPVKGRVFDGWRYPTYYRRGFRRIERPYGLAYTIYSKGSAQQNYVYTSEEVPQWSAVNEGSTWALRLKYSNSLTTVTPPLNLRNRVDTEILNKLSTGNLNLGVAIAESRQTVSMLSQNVISLVRAFSAARRGNWRTVFTELGIGKHKFKAKDISSRWLEISFGWKPLLSDIHAAYEVLNTKLVERMPMRAVRMVGIKNEFTYTHLDNRELKKVSTYTETISRKATIWYYIDDSRLAWAASLGLLNPAVVAWEKVPFSFLVDWLIPVGNVLDSVTNRLGVSFISGTYTDKSVCFGKTEWEYKNRDPSKDWVGKFRQDFSQTSYERKTMSRFPLPKPYYKSPVSTAHAILALALIHQRMRF